MVETSAPLLHIQHLTFGYTSQPLLYDIQMQVQSGEMVGLLGPNGSGKTTLLRLVSGVLRPQKGTILLEGRELPAWGRRGIAQRVAVVPQELQVPFAFPVEQMVALGRTPFISLLGAHSRHDLVVVQEAMQSADVVPLASRVFNELSGGERQRVMVAMALAQQPRLLLLDEPTAHLDIKYQIDILELVQHLNRTTGVAVIAAMHDLNLAARYFPRLLLFQRGIVADAGPAEVLEPHLLQRVYGVNVQVGILRGAEHLSVLPPGSSATIHESEEQSSLCVHVMAGGGSGAVMMRALADSHIPFSAGVLNIGDSDHTLALRLANEVITEQPYAPFSPATLEALRARLQTISLLILCPMPIGPGNLALFREALSLAQQKVPVVLLAPTEHADTVIPLAGEDAADKTAETLLRRLDLPARDYTHGEGTELVRQALLAGATVIETVRGVVETAKGCAII